MQFYDDFLDDNLLHHETIHCGASSYRGGKKISTAFYCFNLYVNTHTWRCGTLDNKPQYICCGDNIHLASMNNMRSLWSQTPT